MVVIREWMREVLDEKAALREKAKNDEKHEQKLLYDGLSIAEQRQQMYERYKKWDKEQRDAAKNKPDESEFNKFKFNYLNKNK